MSGDDDTLAETQGEASRAGTPSPDGMLGRYRIGEALGRGGMGEVWSARDEQIGRQVAIKRLRVAEPSTETLGRFLREAHIQGRLEHPAIVPVHELAYDAAGQPFFVMKQLTGITLAEVFARQATGDVTVAHDFSRTRLLRAFADVCLAIEFAHTRGVVHRDLKPANVVLGDFGEVYVLDWGIARVAGDADGRASFADIDTMEGTETMSGAILGTPGYISPEQIRGDADLDGRADIYALGCMLFEILAQTPLHPRGQPALATALAGIDGRPSQRAASRDIPPELDAICVRATALDRTDRFATARQLGSAVQAFLDGDRDVSLRKQLARSELASAQAVLARGDGATERRLGLRAAARALALDPTTRDAADLVGRLMLEPPSQVPHEVEDELAQLDRDALRTSARFGTYAALAYLAFFPILYWIGFRDLRYLGLGAALCASIALVEVFIARRDPMWSGYLAVSAHLALIVLIGHLVSPFIIATGPPIIIVMLLATHPELIRTPLLALLAALATLAPWLVTVLGFGADSVGVHGSDLVLHTKAGALAEIPTQVGLVLYVIVLLTLATLLSRSQENERRTVRRTLQIQSWQLRQLVPRAHSLADR